MTYFDVSRNARPLVVAGAPAIRVLTVGALVTPNGPATLSVTGMAVANGERTYLFRPQHYLSNGDVVTIRVLAEGVATPPSSTTVEPELPVQEELARLRAELEGNRHADPPSSPTSYSHTRAPKSSAFTVTSSSGASVVATLGHANLLQSVVTLRGGVCYLEVDSFLESSVDSKRWLSSTIEFNESTTIAYAT